VTDLSSRNGTKVNGKRVTKKRVDPGATLAVAKHSYHFEYSPTELGAVGPPPPENEPEEILAQSLLQRAGLDRDRDRDGDRDASSKRYDVRRDRGGSFRDPNEPI
jgi:adenylate cyclase